MEKVRKFHFSEHFSKYKGRGLYDQSTPKQCKVKTIGKYLTAGVICITYQSAYSPKHSMGLSVVTDKLSGEFSYFQF